MKTWTQIISAIIGLITSTTIYANGNVICDGGEGIAVMYQDHLGVHIEAESNDFDFPGKIIGRVTGVDMHFGAHECQFNGILMTCRSQKPNIFAWNSVGTKQVVARLWRANFSLLERHDSEPGGQSNYVVAKHSLFGYDEHNNITTPTTELKFRENECRIDRNF